MMTITTSGFGAILGVILALIIKVCKKNKKIKELENKED